MNVIIRVDSSVQIGTGHVMRCMTLAREMSSEGINVFFITRRLEGNVSYEKMYPFYFLPKINEHRSVRQAAEGFIDHIEWYKQYWQEDVEQVLLLMQREQLVADMVIVDHYGLDFRWEQAIRPHIPRIMVIDDLADRNHSCDLLLDQNYVLDVDSRYSSLIPKSSVKLLGPSYALLRKEFITASNFLKSRDGKVKRVLVTFGGSDPTSETIKVLQAFEKINLKDIYISVIIGKSNPFWEQIKNYCDRFPNYRYYHHVDNMAEMMINHDLAIGAGGTTTWERCFLGLPSLTIVTAKNQLKITEAVAAYGATKYLGESKDIAIEDIINNIKWAIQNPTELVKMSQRAKKLMGDRRCKWKGIGKVMKLLKEERTGSAKHE